jgi:hypothetical protein
MTEIGTDWRVVDGVATAWFDASSLIEGAALALPYGEVGVGPGEIAIGVESLPRVSPVQRGLYDLAVAPAGVDTDNGRWFASPKPVSRYDR